MQKKSKQSHIKGNYQGVKDHETENQEKNRGRDHLRPGTYEADGAQAGDLLQDRRPHDGEGPAPQKNEAQGLQARGLVGDRRRAEALRDKNQTT